MQTVVRYVNHAAVCGKMNLIELREELIEINDEVRNRRNALVINKLRMLIEEVDEMILEEKGEDK